MIEQLITFETAKLAKEKGFTFKTKESYSSLTKVTSRSYNEYSAPTQSLLQKRLREVHNLIVQPYYEEITSTSTNIKPSVKVLKIDNEVGKCSNLSETYCVKEYNTYELALEQGLQEALKLIRCE